MLCLLTPLIELFGHFDARTFLEHGRDAVLQNLFGLAVGPVIAGTLSDAVGLEMALILTSMGCVVAALSFLAARHTYADECVG